MSEREQFEAWLGTKPNGPAHDLAWLAWEASAARAQPAQAGQVLTDDQCLQAIAPETWTHIEGVWKERALHDARAIEAAVLEKRVPMPQSDLIRMSQDYADIEDEETAFRDGWRRAEIHHGIVGEKGGA